MEAIQNETYNFASMSLDSSQSLVSMEIYSATYLIFENIRISAVVVAIFLNTINAVVHSRRSMRSPTSSYLIASSLTQIVYSVLFIIYPTVNAFGFLDTNSLFNMINSLIIRNYFMVCLGRAMYSLTCLVSIERCLAIAFPLKAKLFRVSRSPVSVIFTVIVLIFISHIYITFKFTIYEATSDVPGGEEIYTQPKLDDEVVSKYPSTTDLTVERNTSKAKVSNYTTLSTTFDNSSLIWTTATFRDLLSNSVTVKRILASRTVWTFGFSAMFMENPELFEVWSMTASAIWVYGTLLLGLVMNVMLIVSLSRHRRQRRAITTNESHDLKERQVRQMTVTIMVASLIFVVLSLPLVTNALFTYIYSDYGYFGPNRYTFLFLQSLGTALSCLSFCTDFVTYVALSSAYRDTLASLLSSLYMTLTFKTKTIISWNSNETTASSFLARCTGKSDAAQVA